MIVVLAAVVFALAAMALCLLHGKIRCRGFAMKIAHGEPGLALRCGGAEMFRTTTDLSSFGRALKWAASRAANTRPPASPNQTRKCEPNRCTSDVNRFAEFGKSAQAVACAGRGNVTILRSPPSTTDFRWSSHSAIAARTSRAYGDLL